MNSFVATAPTTTPDSNGDATTIANDGWFPDIDLDELRQAMKIDGAVPLERLRHSALDAIATANADLGEWQAKQAAAGFASLAAVPAPQVGGASINVQRYQRAVYHLTHADITEKYRGYDSTKSGGQKAEDLEETSCHSRRNARWAMNDIRGIARSTVELI